MPKENNQFQIDHAFPGLCSLCHVEVAEYEGSNDIGSPIVKRFKPNAKIKKVFLSDGSQMNVMLCKGCHDVFNENNFQELIESEINGWAYEVETHLKTKWDESRKKKYLNKMSKLRIEGSGKAKPARISRLKESVLKRLDKTDHLEGQLKPPKKEKI